jgi:hypothetical protein
MIVICCRQSKKDDRPPFRQYMMDGDFFIGAALGSTLVKLCLRYKNLNDPDFNENKFCAEAMLIIASILHLGKSGLSFYFIILNCFYINLEFFIYYQLNYYCYTNLNNIFRLANKSIK